jgi:hypothetical protein
MSLGATLLTIGNAASVASQATASITLATGKLYFLWVANIYNPTVVATPTCSGWTQVATHMLGSEKVRITCFIRDGNGSTGAHTIAFGGQTQDGICWSIDEWTDAAPASSAVVQVKTAFATCTFDSNLASEANAVYQGGSANTSSEYLLPEAGFTTLADYDNANGGGGVQYRIGSDSEPPSPTMNCRYFPSIGTIGLEVAAAEVEPESAAHSRADADVLASLINGGLVS